MIPEDDFLLIKPARRESVTAVRIALMAALGCLILLSVLVFQARAEPHAMLDRQIRETHQAERPHAHAGSTSRLETCLRHPAC
jgi:cytochrome c-type biogenesis protein CcmH/NrfG